MMFGLPIATLTTLLAAGDPEPLNEEPPTLDAILEHVRRATGIDRLSAHPAGVQGIGTARLFGNDVPFMLRFDAHGRFVQHFEGPLPQIVACDGERVWTQEHFGPVRVLEFGERAEQVIVGAALTGSWLAPRAPFRLTLDSGRSDPATLTLAFAYAQGHEEGTIEIDRATWLPRRWTFNASLGKQSILLEGASEFDGLKLPKRSIQESANGGKTEIQIEHVTDAPDSARSADDPPTDTRTGVRFDPASGSAIQVERAPTGHLLVFPRVNGGDAGWFIFDTGAGSSVISTPEAGRLGLRALGEVPALGVGGAVQAPLYRVDALALGPLTLEKPVVAGIDLSFLAGPLGRPIGGVAGYDLICRAVVELDLDAGRISLHDPATFKGEGLTWRPLHLPDRIPVVDASFEDHRGPIRLDTGAAGTGLLFHFPAVQRFKLLDRRETRPSMSGGVGGMVAARAGKLDWFEIGGHRFEHVDAVFAMEPKGAFNDPYAAGIVGGEILRRFILVLDYQNRRIAFRLRPS